MRRSANRRCASRHRPGAYPRPFTRPLAYLLAGASNDGFRVKAEERLAVAMAIQWGDAGLTPAEH